MHLNVIGTVHVLLYMQCPLVSSGSLHSPQADTER